MAIVEKCSHCGHRATAPDAFGGRKVGCPQCGEPIHFPTASLDADELLPTNVELGSTATTLRRGAKSHDVKHDRLLVRCDKCFQRYLVPPSAIDQQFDCPKCQHRFCVPRETLDAKQRAAIAAASGLSENVVAEAAADSPTLGAEMLVEVGLMDEQGSEGTPLREQRGALAWLPSGVRRSGNAIATFVQDHPLGLAMIAISVTLWLIAMAYVLR